MLPGEIPAHLARGERHNLGANEPVDVVLLLRSTSAANQCQQAEGVRLSLQKRREKPLPTGFVTGSSPSTKLVFVLISNIRHRKESECSFQHQLRPFLGCTSCPGVLTSSEEFWEYSDTEMPGLGILRGTEMEPQWWLRSKCNTGALPTLSNRVYATPVQPNEADSSQPSHPIPWKRKNSTSNSSKLPLYRHLQLKPMRR